MLLCAEHTVYIGNITASNIAIGEAVRLGNCVAVNIAPSVRLDETCSGVVVCYLSEGILVACQFGARIDGYALRCGCVAESICATLDNVATPNKVVEAFVEYQVGIGGIIHLDGVEITSCEV